MDLDSDPVILLLQQLIFTPSHLSHTSETEFRRSVLFLRRAALTGGYFSLQFTPTPDFALIYVNCNDECTGAGSDTMQQVHGAGLRSNYFSFVRHIL